MKHYPSIDTKIIDIPIYAFDKIDGSNIRAEWEYKKGFNRFGSRNRLISEDEVIFGESINLIKEKYEKDLSEIFEKQKYKSAVCFFEFFGPNSQFGVHQNEIHDVILFDINPYKKGFISPDQFIFTYGHLDIPKLVYNGMADDDFINNVKNRKFENITFEGVVCKGVRKNQVVMFKIKTNDWLNKLKIYCNGDMNLFDKIK